MAGLNEYDSLATDLFKSNKPTSDLVEAPRQNSEPNAEYNDLAAESAQAEKQRLQQSLYVADKKDPNREAEVVRISKKLNMPMDIVDRNFDTLKKQTEPATDYDAIIKDTPNLANWLKDPVNATISKDDLDKLGVIDGSASRLKSNTKKEGYFNLIPSVSESKQALTTGYNDLSASAGHLAVVFGKMAPDDAVEFIAESNRKSRELRAQVPNYVTEYNNRVEQIDVDAGWQQFLSGFEQTKQGRIKEALIAYGQGGGRTVADTLELIGSSVIRPRALIYTAMQSLAHSAPSLITGWAGAKVGATGALVAGQLGPQAALPEEIVTVPLAATIGFGVGSFAGSAPTEVGSWINQAMQERGVDITSPDSLRDAYSDAKLMADIKAEAIRKGVTTAAVDGLFSAFAGKFIRGAAPDASLATRFAAGAKELGVQATGESLSEGAGQYAARGELGQISLSEVLQEGITSFGHSMGEVAIQAPGQVRQLSADTLQAVRSRFSPDPLKAAEQVVGQVETAMEAQSDARELAALGEAVRDSKTAGRMPEAIKNLIDTAAEGGETSNIYFQADDWDNHWNRKGMSPSEAAANIMGDDGEAYFRAKNEGTQFAVPMSDYVSKVAAKENFADFEALMPFARVRADGMSLAESQEILSALPSLMDQLAQESVMNPEVPNAADPALNVQNQVNDRLMEIGFDETTADQYSQIYGSAFRALAERTGLNADELFNRYGLQISRLDTQRSNESAAQYDQRVNDPVRQEFVDFLNSKGKVVVRGQLIMPYMLREAGAPQEMIDRLIEYNKPENDPAEKMLEVYRRKRFNQNDDVLMNNSKKLRDQGFDFWVSEGPAFDDDGQETQGPSPGEAGYSFTVFAQDNTGNDIGQASFIINEDGQLVANDLDGATEAVTVDPSFRRQGIATELYRMAAEHTGKSIADVNSKTESGAAFRQALRDLNPSTFNQNDEGSTLEERMARAEEQGFDTSTVYYHGSRNGNIEAFDPEKAYHSGIRGKIAAFLTTDPSVASQYAEGTSNPGSNVLPVYVRVENTFDPDNSDHIEILKNELKRSASKLSKDFKVLMSDNNINYWSETIKDPELGWTILENEFVIDAVHNAGFDSAISKEKGTRNLAVFDPSDIRSVNAQFNDPESTRILAQGGQDPRGQITFGNATVNIDLLPKANLSTFLHETGHFMLEVMGDIAESPDAPESIRQDYATLLQFFGVESRDQIETKHHEQFARSFEAYLMEGKAPSQGLRKAFSKFRSWLTAIYRTIRNLNVELTPEVRGVFDRMLATDQELAEAGASANLQPMFTDPAQSGMNETQAAEYAETIEEARQAAETELQTKLMADMVRERKAFYRDEKAKVRAEVEAQINSNPVYIAASVLQRGKMPDGSEPADGLKGIKLDRDALIQQYGKDFLKRLPRPYMYSKDGLNPNLVAEMFGFKSGDEMITNIMNSPKRESLINLQTDAIMKDRHGDLLNDPSLPDEAMKAVHNEKRSLLLRKEIEYLASEEFATFKGLTRRISRRMPSVDAVRQQAERTVAGMKVRNISPVVYQRAETKASRDAMEAFLRGDFNAAFEAKQKELLNHELYRATIAAREQTDKVVDYMKRFTKTETRKRLGKAGEAYLGQIDSLMERFEFVRGVSLSAIDKRESLVKWVEEQRAQGIEPLIPEKVMNEAYRISYKEMTMDELNGIYDAARNIAHLAKVKNELLANQRQRDLQAAKDEAIASINGNSKGLRPVQIETRRKELELRRLGAGFLAEHRKLSNILREMDGWQDGGSMWDLVMRPLNDAANRETEMNAVATQAFQKLFSAYTVKDRSRFWKEQYNLSPKTFFPSLKTERFDGNVTKEGMLMIALNWGNLDNRVKLMEGMGWNEGQVQEVFAQLDERDWTFVQGVWDLIDSYWPETKAVAQRVDGIAPGKVEASAFEVRTSDGKNMVIKGGYFPLKYDSRRAPQAFANEAAEKAKATMAGAAVRATTAHGHRKERVQGVQMPVRLDFGVMTEHVQQVIHDITHYETIIDMNRLIGSKDIQDAVIANYGDIIYGEVRDAITDIAAGQETARTSVEKALSYIRTGMTFASMGWNLNTVLQQPLGLTQSVFRVGPKWVARGVGKFLGSPTKMTATIDMIYEKSSFMKNRGQTQNREINEIRNGVNKSEWKSNLEASFLYLIQKGQLIADVPTWLGAYEKAMEEQGNASSRDQADEFEKRAVALADQAVIDSQSGGQIKDLAKIQRKGPLWKVWTAFYSYFSATYNLNYEAVSRADFRRAQDVGRMAVDLLTVNVLPATLSTLLYLGLKGDLPEDGEEWAKELAQANASYLLGNMIGLRELGGAVSGFNGYEGPAGARFFSDATKLIKNAQDGEMDEATIRALNKTAGILFQYPAGQLDRTWRGLNAWLDGETKNPMAVIMGPPRN